VLEPGHTYLGVTLGMHRDPPRCVPFLEGKSSVGRLGIEYSRPQAGKGDVGFTNHWTLEYACSRRSGSTSGCRSANSSSSGSRETSTCHIPASLPPEYNQRSDPAQESMMWKNQF